MSSLLAARSFQLGIMDKGGIQMSKKKNRWNRNRSIAKRHPVLRTFSVIILGCLFFIAVLICCSIATLASEISSPVSAPLPDELNSSTFPEVTVFDSTLVSEIQTRLQSAGYYYVDVNGYFDSATGAAIKNFQYNSGLAADGIVGPATASSLGVNLGDTEKLFYNINLEELANASNSNHLIYISLRSKTLTVFERTEGLWTRLLTVPCAIGRDDSPTVLGIFQIYYNSDDYFVHGNYLYYYPSFFYGNYGLHSVSYDPNSGYWGTEVLGEKVTNGCVRVEPEMALWIQTNCPVNTYVAIDDRAYNP